MKIGTIRYVADIDPHTGKVEFTELVLRSSLKKKRYLGVEQFVPTLVNYWVVKVKYLSWVKLSKAHGDWGWAKNIPDYMRHARLASSKQPGRPTRQGALKELLADARRFLKEDGDAVDPEFPDELPYSIQIKKIQTALKRLK